MQPATRASNQPLGGASGDWRYRILRFHLPLALASVGAVFLWMSLPLFQAAGHRNQPQAAEQHGGADAYGRGAGHQGPPEATGHERPAEAGGATRQTEHSENQTAELDGIRNRIFMARFTTATGYVALGLLVLTLLIGPANLLLHRRNPVSSYLRRDVGTWTAIVSVIHVIAGFQVHGPAVTLGERILRYFFAADGSLLTDDFGLGNWTGLAATVIVVGLLAISSDVALRKLKAGPWKNLQRLNYALFVLVVAHAIRRTPRTFTRFPAVCGSARSGVRRSAGREQRERVDADRLAENALLPGEALGRRLHGHVGGTKGEGHLQGAAGAGHFAGLYEHRGAAPAQPVERPILNEVAQRFLLQGHARRR